MIEVITPPNEYTGDKKSVFLAGPIQGAGKWHERMIDLFQKKDKDFVISSPKLIDGLTDHEKQMDYIEMVMKNLSLQVDWETKHLHKAAKNGVIVFWLGKEEKHYCNRAYAQTTRYELAEWINKSGAGLNIDIVVGYDKEFPGLQYIQHRLKELEIYNEWLFLYNSMEKVVKKTLELL